MIRYHGGPITPTEVAVKVWTGRHAMVSFARSEQVQLAAEVAHSFSIDNGAYTTWRTGEQFDMQAYRSFVDEWRDHPGCDWHLIPDVIDGDEQENLLMTRRWGFPSHQAVPVYHMHETLDYFGYLMSQYPRVAIGSSGEFATIGTDAWWRRMLEIMEKACPGEDGRPIRKLHGLRMMSPTIFSHIPFASVDSSGVAQNHHREPGGFKELTPTMRALVLADRYENHASAPRYTGSKGVQMNLDLVG